jgi:hypothetical protein
VVRRQENATAALDPSATLIVGEIVGSDRRRFHVRADDLASVARMRAHLIDAARAGETVTYGELVREAELPVPPKALGRLLVLLSEDCARRGEPTLAAIVVTASTREVGDGYGPGAEHDRKELHRFWARRPGALEGAR